MSRISEIFGYQKKAMNEAISRFFGHVVENEPIAEHGAIKPRLRAEILAKITSQIADLLSEDQTTIFPAYSKCAAEHYMEKDSNFKFPLTIKSVIESEGIGYQITTLVSFSTKHSVDVTGYINKENTPDMFEGDDVPRVTLSSEKPGKKTTSVTLDVESPKKLLEVARKLAKAKDHE